MTSREVPPVKGILVSFLSEQLWHEVLPCRRKRMSITDRVKTRGG